MRARVEETLCRSEYTVEKYSFLCQSIYLAEYEVRSGRPSLNGRKRHLIAQNSHLFRRRGTFHFALSPDLALSGTRPEEDI